MATQKQIAREGLLWTAGEYLFGQIIGFVQGILLARLLCPEDFGLAAMLGIFLAIGGALSDCGLGNALIAFGGSRRTERHALVWNVGVGLFLYLLCAVAAPWIAAFYDKPVLTNLLRVMALVMPLNAACVVGCARLNRAQRFATLSSINAVVVVVVFAVGVSLAWCGWGVWAIAWMNLTWSVMRFLLLTGVTFRDVAVPHTEKPFGGLLAYGFKLTVSELIASGYYHAFPLVVGRVLGPAMAGVWMRSLRWSQLAGDIVNASVSRVSFATFSRGEGGALRYLGVNLVLVWPCLVLLGVFAEPIVRFVLGEAWLPCVPYLRILLVAAMVAPVNTISVNLLKAWGEAGLVLKSELVKRPLAVAYLAVGVFGGMSGVCWALVVNQFTEALINAGLVGRFMVRSKERRACL